MMILSAIIAVVEARVFVGPNLLFCAEAFDCELVGKSIKGVVFCGPRNFLLCSEGGLEPALRVLFSAIFHGVSLGNFHQGSNLWKGVESKL